MIRTLDLGRPSTPDPEHPFEKLFNNMELQKSIVDSTWDEPVTTAPLAKGKEPEPFSNPLNFSRSSIGYKLKVTRVEQKTLNDGERWAYAYSGDELVDARLIRE